MVCLSYNSTTHPPFAAASRMPQGSPYSPLLSALYISPLLCCAEEWDDSNLVFYIDNGAIYVAGATYSAAADKAHCCMEEVCCWL
jgi:hypothetical protein